MRDGQRATIEVDALGGREFNGHVDSLAAATGARFSLLPPENATGNYVKVVQRVPVEDRPRPGPGSRSSPAARHVGFPDGLHEVAPWRPSTRPSIRGSSPIAVMFATFMEVLDTTVVNVSLPHIAGNLSATIDESTWVLTSYLVANAIVLPLTGWLASHFGRKRLLMTSVIGFTIASLLCGLAPNLPLLVTFRLIQGATGGAMQPLSQAVLLEAFPPQDRGRAMGFWGLGIVVAPILGPVLGGWLTDTYSWRWVFYINLPVGIASLVMTKLYVFDPPYLRRETERIDYWGIGLLARVGGCAAARARSRPGARLAGVEVHLRARDHFRRRARRVPGTRVDGARARRRSACVQDQELRHRRVPDDDARVRAVREPRAPSDHAADAARLSVAAGGDRDGAARHGIAHRDAGDRDADRPDRSAQDGRGRADRWGASRSSGSAS